MLTVTQLANRASVAPNTIRNYVRDFPDLFSEDARGCNGNRRFNDDDVEAICTLVALKASGLPLAEAAEQLRTQATPTVIDVAASEVQETPQEASTALQPRAPDAIILQQAFSRLQDENIALQRRYEAHMQRQLWTHGVAFYAGVVTMGVIFFLVWWLVNGAPR